jgi:hypothetical protein
MVSHSAKGELRNREKRSPRGKNRKCMLDEMKLAEKLIARIIFLEASPTVSKPNAINIGADVETMHKNDQASILAGDSTPGIKTLELILPTPRYSLEDTWGLWARFSHRQ